MPFIYLLKTALTGLSTNKSRSALTILGIVIGITAVIMVLALGKGAENLMIQQIQGFGSKTVSIEPGKDPTSLQDIVDALYTNSLKDKDIVALQKKANVRGLAKLSPMLLTSTSVSYSGESERAQVVGGDDFYLEIFGVAPEYGTVFGEGEIKQKARVAVIGWEIKEDLFGFSEALGKKVKINNQNFRIVGILPKSGSIMGQNIDRMVLAPHTTVQKLILGIDYYHAILVEAKNEDIVHTMADDIRQTLRETHGISDPSKDDFRVITMDEAADRVGTMLVAFTVLLSAVSAISLVVGGIGIMNIMLVSVTERTREIGLRKALGATSADISSQFLLESVILTGIGGIVGIALGAGLAFVFAFSVTHYGNMDWEFVFPIRGAIMGLGVAAGVGLVFGIYPASQAARKSPIEALRYE